MAEGAKETNETKVKVLRGFVEFTWSTETQVFLQGERKLTTYQGGRHDKTVKRREEV